MRRSYWTKYLALVCLVGFIGCETTPVAQDSTEDKPDAVTQGAELYSRHCQRCHHPRNPVEYDDRQWGVVMQHMQVRANLTRRQAELVLTYVTATNEPATHASRVETPDESADADSSEPTSEMMQAGREVYRGQGTCAACHGAELEGGPVAPNLRDDEWKRIDGSYGSILKIIRQGVPGTTMNAYPGGIDDEQAKQVAAYVWGVSRGDIEP